jgi:putative FmdB family regulatory protein
MPLYEYHCRGCGTNIEVRQKFSDAPLTRHEGCGGVLEKVLSAPALHFKGTGWYVTDYGRGKSPAAPAAKGSNGSNGKPETKSGDKSETKTPVKAESKSDSKSETKSTSQG